MIDRVKNLKKHLGIQIRKAQSISSKWVYILEEEAETCLKLAESEEEILRMLDPVEPELEGGGSSWWHVCGAEWELINPEEVAENIERAKKPKLEVLK